MSSNWIARQTSLKRALCRSNWIRVRSRWKWTPGQKKIQMSENKQQRCSAKIFEAVFFCCCQACKTRSGGFCLSIRWKILVNFQKTWKWERSLSCLAQIDTGESCFLSLPLSAFFCLQVYRTVTNSFWLWMRRAAGYPPKSRDLRHGGHSVHQIPWLQVWSKEV